MYREVLEYIRELGEERDLSPDRQGEVRECMDGIAKEICGIYGLTMGKSEKGKREKNYSFHGTYQCVARYLTADTESGICIGIYGERSLEKKSRYCICIGTAHAFLHSKKETNEEERERLKKNRKQYYSFIDMKLRDGLCYTYKNMYGSGDEDIKTKDPRTIFVHKEKELKNKDENIIREFVKEKTDTVKDNDDDIEPCYLIEAETEDGKLRTEEELKADRSIALLDTALRRRFSFVEMMPDTEVLKDIKIEVPEMPDTVDKKAGKSTIDIQKLLEIINQRIEVLYDREHTIGHAYFCGLKKTATLDGLKNVFKKSVLPLLQEYFFDDYEKIAMVLGDNQKRNRNYKFIVEDNGKDIHTLFGKELETDMLDMLQRKKYMINEKAFDYAESYIQIYEPSRKN